MLKNVLSISGKPGLYKLVSQGKGMLIVESLVDNKRFPAYSNNKVMSLGNILMYTDDAEVPLWQIFETIRERENGAELALTAESSKEELSSFFAEVLPTYDRDRVYPNDIKRVVVWYNLLIKSGMTSFVTEE